MGFYASYPTAPASVTSIDGITGDVSLVAGSNITITDNSGAKTITIAASAGVPPAMFFGNGSDGDVTVSAPLTLSRDMYYHNLTINGSGAITTNGFCIFISGTLDLSAAPAGAIQWNGNAGSPSTSATGGAGATSLSVNASHTTGINDTAAATGGNGGTTTGSNGTARGNTIIAAGGGGNASGAGGAGTGGSGGTNGGVPTNASPILLPDIITPTPRLIFFNANVGFSAGGVGGGSGGGGGGASGVAGFGGGGGGGGAGTIFINANTIARGTNATASIIQAIGGQGGSAGNSVGSNCGGGGGGSGGGGGCITLQYLTLTGSTITNALDVSGGAGGNGGNGVSSGIGGTGGGNGGAGRVTLVNLTTGTLTSNFAGSTGTTGSGPTGATGGGGASLNTYQVNL